MSDTTFLLKYSHNIIEHLGLKLYQNKPTNVVAELVSNSWDADAKHVWIDTQGSGEGRYIAVADNGCGMSDADLRDRYLVIGRPKRRLPTEQSLIGRRYMGRKGIGKLAPFGIATTVDLVTVHKSMGQGILWLRLELNQMLSQPTSDREAGPDELPTALVTYQPKVIARTANFQDVPLESDPSGGMVKQFLRRVSETTKTGTLVLLTSLSIRRELTEQALSESLGRRFTVTLNRADFSVSINGRKIDEENSLPKFEFRIPQEGYNTTSVNGKDVRFWVGFVAKADWPQDQAGVGVYAHGKLAQDRPFTFGLKGGEIFSRYMYGVVEADWLDEEQDDLISTDRTSVNWEAESASLLYNWGHAHVRTWISAFERSRKDLDLLENIDRIDRNINTSAAPQITQPERKQIADLLSNITPKLGKNEQAKDELIVAVTEAWIQKPMRRLIHDLWAKFESSDINVTAFTHIISELREHTVPESLGLAVTFAQRAYALKVLHERINLGTETSLQRLIETFPWILAPDKQKLTANQQLKTVIMEAERRGLFHEGTHGRSDTVMNEKRPDFVFLSDAEDKEILVVELKNPQEDLTIDNREQLRKYLVQLERQHPKSLLTGMLVGSGHVEPTDVRIKVVTWTEIFRRSYALHVDLLAAMLSPGIESGDDARMMQVREFGGDATWDLLMRVSAKDERLADLINLFKDDPNKAKARN